MSNLASKLLAAAAACLVSTIAAAAPGFRILYQEPIQLRMQAGPGHRWQASFLAFGRQFDAQLQSNETMQRALPAGRGDILPLRGTLAGQSHTWVRLTRTRGGWRGALFDGEQMYAIAPASEIAAAAVQPLGTSSDSAPVIYRFADALLPGGRNFCEIVTADGLVQPDTHGTKHESASDVTAAALYRAVVRDLTAQQPPSLRLAVGVVADYEYFQHFSADPEGVIIARMNIVDGIFSEQAGVKIALGPLTVLRSAQEPFTKSNPTDLLAQLRQYRGSHADQLALGVTHLMTGRDMDGDIVGLAYLDSVCNGDTADSLSEADHSTTMAALIAAHELGHNFNAPHDGVPGACATTPQTFLMAPQVNFSSQFSSCSLQQIRQRTQTAHCLMPYVAPDVALELSSRSLVADVQAPFNLSFVVRAIGDDPSSDVAATAAFSALLRFQSAAGAGSTCTPAVGSVNCALGVLMPGERRRIDLTFVGLATGSAAATLSVSSSNDRIASDNSAAVAIELGAAPATPAPAAASATHSSGGGGSLDPLILSLMAALAARRFKPSRGCAIRCPNVRLHADPRVRAPTRSPRDSHPALRRRSPWPETGLRCSR